MEEGGEEEDLKTLRSCRLGHNTLCPYISFFMRALWLRFTPEALDGEFRQRRP
jgi:hypothetical protein